MKRLNTRLVGFSCLAALVAMIAMIASTVIGPSPSKVRAADIDHGQRTIDPASGTSDLRIHVPPGAWIGGNGVVEPASRETMVAAQVPGRIRSVLVEEGEFVDVGAPLVTFENDVELASVRAAEAELAVAKAELRRIRRGRRKEDVQAARADTAAAQARADLATETLRRTTALAEAGVATADELDRARAAAKAEKMTARATAAREQAGLHGRKEDVAAQRSRVRGAEARLEQARAMVDRLVVRAPITAEVLRMKHQSGEYYTPGAGDELVLLGDTRRLRVRMDVEERDIGGIREGALALVTADAFPERRIPGSVLETARRMGRKNIRTDDPSERTDTKILEVVVELEQQEGLVPGQRVMVFVAVNPESGSSDQS